MPEVKERPFTRQELEESVRIYKMPKVEQGDIVVFYQDCDYRYPLVALVLGVDVRTVALLAFPKANDAVHFGSVRYRGDPLVNNPDVQQDGAWEARPVATYPGESHDSVIEDMREEINLLKAAVQKLINQPQAAAKK